MAPGLALADDYPFLDGLTRYAERIDPVSVEFGDAQDVNAAIQTDRSLAAQRPRPANSRERVAHGRRGRALPEPDGERTALMTISPVITVGGGGGGRGRAVRPLSASALSHTH